MKLQFFGAARTVTGSKHLITTNKNEKILLDCGFFQGSAQESDLMNHTLGFNPNEIDYLILSHAHIDHSGNIPYLVKSGFKGPIYCTPPTLDLCKIMLKDSAHIQENDLKHVNQRRTKRGEKALLPLYSVAEVELAIQQFIAIPYNKIFAINEDINFMFTDSGHILGSAAVNLQIKENDFWRKICFTGDIGRYDGSILRDPEPFPQCDILISESTYGDRLHTEGEISKKELLDVIYNTCVEKKGKLIIPAFSLGRTQEIVYALDQLETQGKLPKIPVYVDSPLSINATNIMKAHSECFNDEILAYMKTDANPFDFKNLIYIQDVAESKHLNSLKEPCIIISASGMVEAGRIKHHVANNVGDKKNTILMVGYAEPTSTGGKLRNGDKTIRVFGEEHEVIADVVVLDSYSAHADYKEMLRYFECLDKSKVKHTFLVHGEYETQLNFKEKLLDVGFKNITIPAFKDEVEI